MAINYTEVGWDTTKYVNPTNMNQMDDGIKAACDGVDNLDSTKLDKSGGTMTGNLTINIGTRGYSNISIGGTNTGTYYGNLSMYRDGYDLQLGPRPLTNTRVIFFPDKSGEVALTSDLSTEVLSKAAAISASSTATVSFSLTVPSGYSIASVTVWTSSGVCAAQLSTFSGSSAIVRVTNYSTDSDTITVYCRALYMKS